MATTHHAPRRMGVYTGGGTVRAQSRTVLWAVAALMALILLAIWVI